MLQQLTTEQRERHQMMLYIRSELSTLGTEPSSRLIDDLRQSVKDNSPISIVLSIENAHLLKEQLLPFSYRLDSPENQSEPVIMTIDRIRIQDLAALLQTSSYDTPNFPKVTGLSQD